MGNNTDEPDIFYLLWYWTLWLWWWLYEHSKRHREPWYARIVFQLSRVFEILVRWDEGGELTTESAEKGKT